MPKDLYDVMLQALRETRGGSVSAAPAFPQGTVLARPDSVPHDATGVPESTFGNPSPVSADRGVILSSVVIDACAQYAFGDRDEQRANQRVAYAMQAEGRSDAEIVAVLRDGATVPVWAGL